jgi:hypothetical protein
MKTSGIFIMMMKPTLVRSILSSQNTPGSFEGVLYPATAAVIRPIVLTQAIDDEEDQVVPRGGIKLYRPKIIYEDSLLTELLVTNS